MADFTSPGFWTGASASTGTVQSSGSLIYILLDHSYQMRLLLRHGKTKFTDFVLHDPVAKHCKVVVNGSYFDVDFFGKLQGFVSGSDDSTDTYIQGQVIVDGKVVAGDSRPESFWFGQLFTGGKQKWTYWSGSGNPPTSTSTLSAIGGVEPLVISALRYGILNQYRSGAKAGVIEPIKGPPPLPALSYLTQRSNATFADANKRPRTTGKSILAYSTAKQTLLVGVQPHGAGPGQTHIELANALARLEFDSAVFLDGSDSATLVVDGNIIVHPGDRKNMFISLGIGFYK